MNRRTFWSRIAACFGFAAASRAVAAPSAATRDVSIPPNKCYACQACGVVDFGGQLAPKSHRDASGWLWDRCAPAPSRYRVDTGVRVTPLPEVKWGRFHWGYPVCKDGLGTPCEWAKPTMVNDIKQSVLDANLSDADRRELEVPRG